MTPNRRTFFKTLAGGAAAAPIIAAVEAKPAIPAAPARLLDDPIWKTGVRARPSAIRPAPISWDDYPDCQCVGCVQDDLAKLAYEVGETMELLLDARAPTWPSGSWARSRGLQIDKDMCLCSLPEDTVNYPILRGCPRPEVTGTRAGRLLDQAVLLRQFDSRFDVADQLRQQPARGIQVRACAESLISQMNLLITFGQQRFCVRRLPLPIAGTGAIGAISETDSLIVRAVLVLDPVTIRQRVVFSVLCGAA